MEPDTERAIAPSPPPPVGKPVEQNRGSITSSHSSHTVGVDENDDISRSSASPSTINEEDERKDEKDVELGQATSAASEQDPPPVKIPRSKRRGLFARFSVIAEVEEPKHYARRTKWFITFIIALAAVAAPLGSAIILRK